MSALAIPIVIVLWRNLGPVGRMRTLVLAAGYVVLGAGLRVAMGRHFFSDALLSVLFSAMIALVLYRLLDIRTARRRFHIEAVPEDLQRIYRAAHAKTQQAWSVARPVIAPPVRRLWIALGTMAPDRAPAPVVADLVVAKNAAPQPTDVPPAQNTAPDRSDAS